MPAAKQPVGGSMQIRYVSFFFLFALGIFFFSSAQSATLPGAG